MLLTFRATRVTSQLVICEYTLEPEEANKAMDINRGTDFMLDPFQLALDGELLW